MVDKTELKGQKPTKPDWYYHQVAVLPFRVEKNRLEILLITSIKKKKWILPKGIAENNISYMESAANEAYEEAGVKGHVIKDPLDSYTVKKWGGLCNVQVYPMVVEKEKSKWPENYVRKRKWCSVEEAIKLVSDAQLSNIIRQFDKWFSRYIKQSKP